MTPSLRQLEYLIALADTGQFIEAARVCAVSQPALSKQIREVEDGLGLTLFERTRPRVIPTKEGEVILEKAREVLARARELTDTARSMKGERASHLRLGVIPTIAPYGLPGLLIRLRQRFPHIRLEIQEIQTHVLLDELKRGKVDLGLLARPFDHDGLDGPDLVYEPFVLVAPADHPLGRPDPVGRAEICGAELLLMQDGHCLRDQAIDVCALAGPPESTTVAAASVSTLVRMVEAGLGPTLLPASALRTEVRPELGLVARGFEGPPPGRTLTLQWRSTTPYAAWFAEISQIVQAHYLSLNDDLPPVAGPTPAIVGV